MRELLIGRNAVNYASSKTSTTANAAANPQDLALGAVGVYLLGVDGSNAGKTVLVTTANLSTVATLAGAAKSEIRYIFAQGTADGAILSRAVTAREFKRNYKKEYAVAQKEVSYVGYNGATGTLAGTPTLAYDEALIGFANRMNQSLPEDEIKSISATILLGDSSYTIASKLAAAINANAISADNAGAAFLGEVVSDGIATAIAFVGSVVYTAGSDTLTVGTSHNVAAGDYYRVVLNPQTGVIDITAATVANSVVYKVLAITATTIQLDRPFTGITQTITQANAITTATKGTVPANVGLRIAALSNVYLQFALSADGLIKYSPITYAVGINPGSGTLTQMRKLEKDAQIARGGFNTADPYLPKALSYIAGTIYDLYFFDILLDVDTVVQSAKAVQDYGMIVAFEDAASIAGQNQYDFDTIVADATNGILGSATAPVSESVDPINGDGVVGS